MRELCYMIWIKLGIMVAKNGLMNISLEKAGKLYVCKCQAKMSKNAHLKCTITERN